MNRMEAMGFVLNDHFQWGSRTYVMAILNATPDSFSGDGLAAGEGDIVEAAMAQASLAIKEGADILDIGGESTRPGSAYVSAEEECARVVPAIAAIRKAFPDIVISIDTYKASVAAAALEAGADIVNDVWALSGDEGMVDVLRASGAPVILMHNRSSREKVEGVSGVGQSYLGHEYVDFLSEVTREIEAMAQQAVDAGIAPEQIILDPGVGFGKTVEQNMALINHLGRVKALGFPVLLGSSRKSFIGRVLEVEADQRVEGTAATVALGIDRGADIVRIHDVRTMVRVARMTDALVRADG